MATAGVSIASAVVEEEGMSAAVETAGDVIPPPIVDAADRQYTPATGVAEVAELMPQRVGAPLMVQVMPQRRVVALLTAVADRMAVVHRMEPAHRTEAANTTSR